MRDRLDRLERLGYLDVLAWLGWRGVRHRLAHEHPDAPELRWAALGDALAAAQSLLDCWPTCTPGLPICRQKRRAQQPAEPPSPRHMRGAAASSVRA